MTTDNGRLSDQLKARFAETNSASGLMGFKKADGPNKRHDASSVKALSSFSPKTASREIRKQFTATYDEQVFEVFIGNALRFKTPKTEEERKFWMQAGMAALIRSELCDNTESVLKLLIQRCDQIREYILTHTYAFDRGDFNVRQLADEITRHVMR